jgi:hypothetical protein
MAQVGVVGDFQTVLAQPRDPDVVGVDGDDEDAAQDGQQGDHDA